MSRNPENTRKLIIEKSLPIFNTKGYHAASISDITNATGITKGAIYGNFKNKDEVAEAAYNKAVEIVLSEISEQVKAEKTAPNKLYAITRYYEGYVLKSPIEGGCPVLNASIEADDNLPLLRTKVVRTISVIRDSLVKIVNRGIIEGQIKKTTQVDDFCTTFYAAIEGGIMISRVEGDNRSYKKIKRMLDAMVAEISI